MARVPVTALLIALGACATIPGPAPSSSLVGAWSVATVSGAAPAADAPQTVEFDETFRVFGSSGCNRYTGAYSYDEASGALTMSPLGVTRRACLDPAANNQEQRLLAALQNATLVEAGGEGAIALVGADGRIELRRRSTARVPATTKPPGPSSAAVASADPLVPQAADTSPLSPTVLPPPSTTGYGLAGGPGTAAPAATPAASAVAPSSTPVIVAAAPTPIVAQPPPAPPILFAGAATLPEGAVLPTDAILRVQIRDVARTNAPATVLGQQEFPVSTGSVHAFSVATPASVIAPSARLTVVAQVLSGNRLLFISDANNAAPLVGASGISVRLVPAARGPATPPRGGVFPVSPPVAAPSSPPLAALAISAEARAYRCRSETFRIAFEDSAAHLTTSDGAVARLQRIDATDDPGAPKMFSNSILTIIKDGERVRFARGRSALTTCEFIP